MLLAADWARFIASFVTNGIRNGGTELQVTPNVGMTVKVDNGTANILGYILQLVTDLNGRYYVVDVPPAHPQYARIDRLVLRLDRRIQSRNIVPVILMGTAASSPTAPALTRDKNIWELSLAQIRVNANVVSISAANITDERFNTDLCGLMNSALGLDPSTWQSQFEDFLNDISVETEAYKALLKRDFENLLAGVSDDFVNWLALATGDWKGQQKAWDTWFQTTNISWQDSSQLLKQEFTNWLAAATDGWKEQQRDWEAWFATVNIDLQTYTQFDFGNLAALSGVERSTVFTGDTQIDETVKIKLTGGLLATRKTVFNANGTITAIETVYANGETLRQSTTTTTFNANGSITEGII